MKTLTALIREPPKLVAIIKKVETVKQNDTPLASATTLPDLLTLYRLAKL